MSMFAILTFNNCVIFIFFINISFLSNLPFYIFFFLDIVIYFNFLTIGEFKDDKKNGVGLEKFKETQIEGSFIDDKLNGRACLYSKLSKIYLEYKDGLKNGKEIELKNDGMIITSEWKYNIIGNSFSCYNNEFFFTGKMINQDEFQGVFYYPEEGSIDVIKILN